MDIQWICAVTIILAWFCRGSSEHHIAVEPPRNLQIIDPGLLGHLYIEWQPPPSLLTLDQCTIKYKLKYRSTGDADWKVVFTKKLKYGDGFDLSKRTEAKVQTLLEGHCTNESEVKSDWTHATFQVPLQGDLESQIRDFHCVYYNWEHLTCTWQRGRLAPPGACYELYYWYEGLDHAVQCSDYIQTHGRNTGCKLQNLRQAEYIDFNVCVNGSSESTQLRPSYFTFHLQNLVKPSPPEKLSVSISACEDVHVEWSPPAGGAPPHCLDYEVQLTEHDGDADAPWTAASTQVETAFTFSQANRSRVSCVRVRGKTNMFCADKGFWSEWTRECFYVSRKDEKQLFILIAVVLSFLTVIIIFILAAQRKKRTNGEKNISPTSLYLD
ncbi:interleukin-13 receptor subunit alpha-2 [Malaclemys terrapin pileata]|uniref:interleukin-13 receptor subunit alpha-2 n=1 Tax=Malaclemys terrapin pileata TaxID=2991368 RepID=UPI0023A7A271|nr:interleukin-13 receptor subunit alpha-2 [Malaclemys terrapin pileata]XP_053895902.1 interleukin-13 receptor subunit alpha-2 [Malaclemys terrapin pileata]XP_053895903.1 interleukin-13 receptor subunit alpha-2 [Malaclemys terrapin pileata]XP_053895904.1 interleukin-13 receptor subunit alpha-2 [Malaclemys terrapin pileata]